MLIESIPFKTFVCFLCVTVRINGFLLVLTCVISDVLERVLH